MKSEVIVLDVLLEAYHQDRYICLVCWAIVAYAPTAIKYLFSDSESVMVHERKLPSIKQTFKVVSKRLSRRDVQLAS